MQKRRAAAAFVVIAGLLSPASAAAEHTPHQTGKTWVAGTVTATQIPAEVYHRNSWNCPGRTETSANGERRTFGCLRHNAGGNQWLPATDGPSSTTTRCPGAADCGHGSGGGWRYVGHTDIVTEPASTSYSCTVDGSTTATTQANSAHCGKWVNVVCPAGQHLHGSTCRADHAAEPACPTDNTAAVRLTWAGHNSAGADATRTKTCPVPGSDSGDDTSTTTTTTTQPPAPTVVLSGGCRIGDPRATLAGLASRSRAADKFNPYTWPDYRAGNGWSWWPGVQEHPGPSSRGTMLSGAYFAPAGSENLTDETELWLRAEIRHPLHPNQWPRPSVREYPEGASPSARSVSTVTIRGNTWAQYSDGRSTSSTGTCGTIRTRIARLEVKLEVKPTDPGASITYYNITGVNGMQDDVPSASALSSGRVWGPPWSLPPISEYIASSQHVPRSAAGVFKIAYGPADSTRTRTYTVTVTAVWEIRITGVTAAGLHAGKTDSVAMSSTLRTVPPLVGAGFDRLVHDALTLGHSDPLRLVARARTELNMCGKPGGSSIWDLLGPE